MALIISIICANAFSGSVGLPTEHLAIPALQGEHQICIWDEAAGDWYQPHVSYGHEGLISFDVPAWGQWYWVGLWDIASEKYVFGKWIGHFKTS